MLRVRPAGPGDYEALCLLFDELDEFHRHGRPEMFRPFPPPVRSREQIAQWIARPDSGMLVAESGEGVVGLLLLLVRTPSGFAGAVPRKVVDVENIVVQADQRGKRIGRRLLAAAMEWARQRQATHVEVVVHDFNHAGRRFYEGFGFRPSTTRLMLAA
jgi:GNAT superfamily N-acetyltransferase